MGAPALAPRRAPARPRKPPKRKPAKRKPQLVRAPAEAPRRRARAATSSKPRPKARAAASRPAKARPRLRVAGLQGVPVRLNGRALAQSSLAGAALIPQAAAGAAGAVRDISDSSLIMRLTRGRGWIAVLCALLVGIVALNVFSLSINTISGRVSQQIAEFERSNSALRASLAEELSASRVEETASTLGLTTPPGDQVTYLEASDDDLEKFLRLLRGETVLSDSVPDTTSTAGYEPVYSPEPGIETVEPSGTTTAPEPSVPAPQTPTTPTTPAPAAPPTTQAPPSGGASGGVGL